MYLDNLESDAGNVSNGVTLSTKTSHKDFIVFFNKVEATIIGNEGCDLLAVLDQLNTNALADGRVRLLSFDSHLKQQQHVKLRGVRL